MWYGFKVQWSGCIQCSHDLLSRIGEIMFDLHNNLKEVKTVAIMGHVRPDGDCVGSCLGLYNYIINNYKGIKVDVYLNPIPSCFSILQGAKQIVHYTGFDLVESIDEFPKHIQGSYVNNMTWRLHLTAVIKED